MRKILSILTGLLLTGSLVASAESVRPQVWDFGADTVAGAQNMLSVDEINSWFAGVAPGSLSANLLDFTASDSVNMTYYCHRAHNHRLRTINMALTHTDEKSLRDSAGVVYRGMIYANSNSDPAIYIEQAFSIGDTIEYVLASNGAPEQYRFYLSDSSYCTTCEYKGGRAEHHRFVCPKDGLYRISGVNEKMVVARIIRYPLQKTLSKQELRALAKEARHPLRTHVERAKYRSEFPDSCAHLKPIAYKDTLWVSHNEKGAYTSINAALNDVRRMKNRQTGQRVVIMIAPGNYEEMLRIDMDEITLKNASSTPSIEIMNKGVDIHSEAVRITGYYGHGYNYYSMNKQNVYDPRTLRANKRHKMASNKNKGGSLSTYWNAVTLVTGRRFVAEDIIFENSFNQYVSRKELTDVVVPIGNKRPRPTEYGSTDVQAREHKERAAAIAFALPVKKETLQNLGNGLTGERMPWETPSSTADAQDEHLMRNCRVISRQDAFYGDQGVRVRVEGGCLMGSVDYIFGGMNLICTNTRLAMLVTPHKHDIAYLTASATRAGERGYIFYNCHVTSAIPLVEMADSVCAQPGYFGRPWAASSETIFINTQVDCTPDGRPLIEPEGWSDGLTGRGAERTYEYGTRVGESKTAADTQHRAAWATTLTEPILPDGTNLLRIIK